MALSEFTTQEARDFSIFQPEEVGNSGFFKHSVFLLKRQTCFRRFLGWITSVISTESDDIEASIRRHSRDSRSLSECSPKNNRQIIPASAGI